MDGKKSYVTALILAALGGAIGMGWIDATTGNAIALAVAGALGASLKHAITKKE